MMEIMATTTNNSMSENPAAETRRRERSRERPVDRQPQGAGLDDWGWSSRRMINWAEDEVNANREVFKLILERINNP
jgi:hypothetical protein